jgi:8-amino-7-oxononanoate synthase
MGCWLMVDDAHGIGVLGEGGAGLLEQQGMRQADVPILVGTLGKSLGTFGAFVAGSDELIEFLIQRARTYIFTTALPPAIAAATRVSLAIVREEAWRRDRLAQLVRHFREGAGTLGLPLLESHTPIQPVLIGDNELAVRVSGRMRQDGFLVSAIRPPTVPIGTARLRVTLTAAHCEDQVDRLLDALADSLPSDGPDIPSSTEMA